MGSLIGALGKTSRFTFGHLPLALRSRLRARLRRWPAIDQRLASDRRDRPLTVRWGDLRRLTPFSRRWGYDRGTPIDRVYIEAFLAVHADDVKGACLEVLNADYTNRFGGNRVSQRDVLDINPANTAATVIADLGDANSLPAQRFDCVILTQTLHLIPDMRIALGNIWRAIAPGGVLLLTVPALSRHDARQGFDHDRWRLTRTGLEWLVAAVAAGRPQIVTYGNLLTCTAFLYGLAAEELRPEELHVSDPEFPLIVAARVQKDPVT